MMMPDDSRRSSQRLPVNPRRHKVAPEQRKRVATACNGCNVRRIKCSGDRPCRQCASTSRECVYPAAVEKVSVARNELDDLKAKIDVYERALHEIVPDCARRDELLQQLAASPTPSVSPRSSPTVQYASSSHEAGLDALSTIKMEPAESDQALIEGRLLQDQDGSTRFLGETSQTAFIDHLKEFVSTALPMTQQKHSLSADETEFLSSLGRYRTSDSRPLPDPDVDPLWLPPNNNLGIMLSELRHFVQDGNGEWSSGGIFWWGDLSSLPSLPIPSPGDEDDLVPFRHLSFYHAALAVTCQSATTKPPANPSSPLISEAYFARATLLLPNPLDTSQCSMRDVATFALLGFYLVGMHRAEMGSMYISAAARTSLMFGAHRGWTDEMGKRLFWTVYVLDRAVSCLLGRSPVISDDSVRIALPEDVPSMPPAAGLRAHVDLSRISGHIVDNACRLTPDTATAESQSQHLERTTWMLDQWQVSLPPTLQLVDGLTSDPACGMLHMQSNQLLILASRPLFFAAVKRSFAERVVTQQSSFESHPQALYLKACVGAAKHNIRLARHLVTLNRRGKLLYSSLHILLDAAIVVLLHELANDETTPTEDNSFNDSAADVDFVMQRLGEEARLGSSYARDAGDTLRSLKGVLTRLKMPLDPGMVAAESAMGEGGPYDELTGWMDSDWLLHGCLEGASE